MYEELKRILMNFEYEEPREAALKNLAILEKKGVTITGKPSAIAGALLYYSKSTVWRMNQKEVVRFLRSSPNNFQSSEQSIRKYFGILRIIFKDIEEGKEKKVY